MRKSIYIAALILLFALGWFSHMLIRGEDTASYHWKKLDQLREHAMNPDNQRSSMGFTYISPPFDDTPHLEALVATGELNKRSVLIPNLPVSRENTKDWMTFASHPDVLQAVAQGDYYDGEVPLSFTIYYKPSFEPKLEAYIDELKKSG
jgi:hypothetical protein